MARTALNVVGRNALAVLVIAKVGTQSLRPQKSAGLRARRAGGDKTAQ